MKLAYAILAGGKGTRMGELTKNRHKCMLKFQGRPIIAHIVDSLIQIGAEEIYLTVNYCKDEIIDYLTLNYPNIKFNFLLDPLMGTGKSVDLLKSIDSDYFMVLMGDMIVSNDDLKKLLNRFHEQPSNCLISKEVLDPRKYGVLEVAGDKIVRIVEKPEEPPSNLINTATYILHRSIFKHTENLVLSKRGEYDLPDAIQSSINNGDEFRHCVQEAEILDFTAPEDLDRLNKS